MDEITGGGLTADVADIAYARADRAAQAARVEGGRSRGGDRFWRSYERAQRRLWAPITNPALRDMRQYLSDLHYGNLDPADWADPELTPDLGVLREIRREYEGSDGHGLERWRADHPELLAALDAAEGLPRAAEATAAPGPSPDGSSKRAENEVAMLMSALDHEDAAEERGALHHDDRTTCHTCKTWATPEHINSGPHKRAIGVHPDFVYDPIEGRFRGPRRPEGGPSESGA